MPHMLVCFTVKSEKFGSRYARNAFFRALYGWTQTVTRQTKRYTYRRAGLLDVIPHRRIDQSSFIIRTEDLDRIERFFERWGDKVIWDTFKILLEEGEALTK